MRILRGGILLVSCGFPVSVVEMEEEARGRAVNLKKLKGKTILFIEDDDGIRYLINRIFKGTETNLHLASGGAEGIETFRKLQEDIDIVLMDLCMPSMNGYEAAEQIRAIKPDTKIIAQSAHAMASEREKCLEAGFTAYLAKPILRDDLFDKIVEVLD